MTTPTSVDVGLCKLIANNSSAFLYLQVHESVREQLRALLAERQQHLAALTELVRVEQLKEEIGPIPSRNQTKKLRGSK